MFHGVLQGILEKSEFLQTVLGEGQVKFVENCIEKTLSIIFVFILMYFSIKMGESLIKRFVQKQVESNATLSLDTQRAKTLGEVLKSVLKYSVYVMGITIILSILKPVYRK
ncbi:MscS family protein YkuT [Clostridium saccharobutylicum DSM 13864]|nr:MscS family protein YkuT [Clostridium saccharobutylicum DSM 13864]